MSEPKKSIKPDENSEYVNFGDFNSPFKRITKKESFNLNIFHPQLKNNIESKRRKEEKEGTEDNEEKEKNEEPEDVENIIESTKEENPEELYKKGVNLLEKDPKDIDGGIKCLKSAAEKGYAQANYKLTSFYLENPDMLKNFEKYTEENKDETSNNNKYKLKCKEQTNFIDNSKKSQDKDKSKNKGAPKNIVVPNTSLTPSLEEMEKLSKNKVDLGEQLKQMNVKSIDFNDVIKNVIYESLDSCSDGFEMDIEEGDKFNDEIRKLKN